ncbi:MAG: hypothetical protein H6868_02120 [Rhodospirillales bacterium]|nr:hypothetical protein [Rhodospirillales bacterium]
MSDQSTKNDPLSGHFAPISGKEEERGLFNALMAIGKEQFDNMANYIEWYGMQLGFMKENSEAHRQEITSMVKALDEQKKRPLEVFEAISEFISHDLREMRTALLNWVELDDNSWPAAANKKEIKRPLDLWTDSSLDVTDFMEEFLQLDATLADNYYEGIPQETMAGHLNEMALRLAETVTAFSIAMIRTEELRRAIEKERKHFSKVNAPALRNV